MHLVGFLLSSNYDARNHELKKKISKYLVKKQSQSVAGQARSLPSTSHISVFFVWVFFSPENDSKSRHSGCFIFCRTASLFTVAILLALVCTTWLVILVTAKVTGDKSSKRFVETAISANCHLSLPRRSTYRFPHLPLRATFPWLSQRSLPSLLYTKVFDKIFYLNLPNTPLVFCIISQIVL